MITLFGGVVTVFSPKDLIKCALTVTMDGYWFVTDYVLLYAIFPFLNCTIHAMDRRSHFMCCAVMFFLFSILPNLVYIGDFSEANGGYSLLWFCVLYIFAAYFRIYVPCKIRYQKWLLMGFILLSCVISGERFLEQYITPLIFGGVMFTSLFYSYNSIVSVFCALLLFRWFRGLEIKSSAVNCGIKVVAPLTFAVYLIHEHNSFRPILWNWLNPTAYAQSPWMIPYVLLCVIGIFVVCCMIEWVRQQIFHICGINSAIHRICDGIQEKVEIWLNSADNEVKV